MTKLTSGGVCETRGGVTPRRPLGSGRSSSFARPLSVSQWSTASFSARMGVDGGMKRRRGGTSQRTTTMLSWLVSSESTSSSLPLAILRGLLVRHAGSTHSSSAGCDMGRRFTILMTCKAICLALLASQEGSSPKFFRMWESTTVAAPSTARWAGAVGPCRVRRAFCCGTCEHGRELVQRWWQTRHRLVTDGVFAWALHPMYAAVSNLPALAIC